MAREKVEFDVVGRDAGGSKAFRQVGDAAARAGDQVEDLGKKSATTGDQVDDLGDKTRKSGREADEAAEQYGGLAAEIATAQAAMRALATEIDRTGNKDLAKDLRRQQAELRKLTRIKDLLPDFDAAGEEAASGFGARFVARVGPILASAPVGPAGAAIGGTLAAALAPTLSAGIAGAVVGGAAGLGIVGGVALAARDPRVQAAGKDLGAFVLGDLEQRASSFTPVVLDGIADVRAGWSKLGPDLTRIFSSSRLVEPLVAGAVSGAQKLVGGIADAVDNADPVVASFGGLLDGVGDAAGQAFTTLADDADAGASSIDDLTTATRNFISATTGIVHGAATVKRWSDEVDVAIDKGRFWTEDWMSSGGVLKHFGIQLDLTADGFKAGSKEAEAYRQATLGTATAADFATLKAGGMTDAEISAADASGKFRAKADEATTSLHAVAGGFSDGSQSVEIFQSKLADLNKFMNEGISANLSAEQANIRLEESIDRATEAAKKNGDGIDANHPKQRANREALVGIATAAQTAAEKIFATTGSHDLAAAATERGRKKFLETADAMGVEEGQAVDLANQLFGIPKDVKTDADFNPDNKGVADWKRTLSGIPRNVFIKAEFDLITNGDVAMALRLGRLSTGGPVLGPGPKGVDSKPYLLAPGEHVITAAEVDAAGGHNAIEEWRAQLRGGSTGDRMVVASTARAGAGGGGTDSRQLASLIGREVGRALSGLTLVLDDRTGRTATLIARGA